MKQLPVKVEWHFVPKVEVKTVPNIDGQPLACVSHQFAPEGIPTKKIYCYGCKRYFPNWGEILRYHKLKGDVDDAARVSNRGNNSSGSTKVEKPRLDRKGRKGR